MTRQQKELSWAAALTVAAIGAALFYENFSIIALPAVAIVSYCAGRRLVSLRTAFWALGAATAVNLAISTARGPANALSTWVSAVLAEFVFAVLPWWVGRYQRLRAEQRERERRMIVDQARLRERASIAADMHDALGHDLAMISLAGGALELDATLTESQRATAAGLRAQAVTAADHLREAIGVLSSAGGPAARHPAGESIDGLVDRTRRAGADISLCRTSSNADVAPAAARACYRIVQESITNATKHAPDSPISVRIEEKPADIVLTITNDVPQRPAAYRRDTSDGGLGLVGLDERARSVGGTISAGVRHHRFTVTARIPRAVPRTPADNSGPTPADGMRDSQKLARHRQWQSAVLPGGIAAALVVAAIVVQAVTVSMTALDPDDFGKLRIGQTRHEIAGYLPSSSIREAPAVYKVPVAPPSATCDFYQARSSIVDLDTAMYRLCFRDRVLVAKDRITQKGSR